MNDIKERIMTVAAEMFSKHGFSKVTTDDLAQEIGISKRTLYNYFPSKIELLDSVFKTNMDRMHARVDEIVNELNEDSDLLDVLQQLMHLEHHSNLKLTKQLFDDIVRYTPDNWKCVEDFKENRMRQLFEKLFALGNKRGHIKESVNEKVAYMILYHAMDNIMKPSVLYELPYTPKEIDHMIFDILLTGMLTEEGVKAFNEKHKNYNH
jgi:AcrR family transcriptional regulator